MPINQQARFVELLDSGATITAGAMTDMLTKHGNLIDFATRAFEKQNELITVCGFNRIATTAEQRMAKDGDITELLQEEHKTSFPDELAADMRRDNRFLTVLFAKIAAKSTSVILRKRGLACFVMPKNILILPPAPDFFDVHSQRLIEAHELIHWTAPALGRNVRQRDWQIAAAAAKSREVSQALDDTEELIADVGSLLILEAHAKDTFEHVKEAIGTRISISIGALYQHQMYRSLVSANLFDKDTQQGRAIMKQTLDLASRMPWHTHPTEIMKDFLDSVRFCTRLAAKAALHLELVEAGEV